MVIMAVRGYRLDQVGYRRSLQEGRKRPTGGRRSDAAAARHKSERIVASLCGGAAASRRYAALGRPPARSSKLERLKS